jgi:hypothetical protein
VDDAYSSSRRATWILVATVLLALGGLVVVQVRLARMTRRYLNLPLVGASAAVFLVLAAGAVVMATAQSSAGTVYRTSYAELRSVATARIEAYTAKSAESIALIYRGTGGDYGPVDQRYDEAMKDAAARLGGIGGVAELTAWKTAHDAVFATAGGNAPQAWQDAAKAATAPGSASQPTINSTFAAFDAKTLETLQTKSAAVDTGLDQGHLGLLLLTWIAVVAGVLAAVAAWTGIAQRLEEYR